VPLGVYFHVPFCRKRCHFCYFRVYTDKNADEIKRYLDAGIDELKLYAAARSCRDESRSLSTSAAARLPIYP
jgi:coproporphyrinogen III oxidase-like Fe-S oxidoreductase